MKGKMKRKKIRVRMTSMSKVNELFNSSILVASHRDISNRSQLELDKEDIRSHHKQGEKKFK